MSVNEFDSYRPPEQPKKRRKRRRQAAAAGDASRRGAEGNREMPMVPDVEAMAHDSYYGKGVVKPPPWGHEVAAYLFLGGVAGGSGLLGAGAQMSKRPKLRRNTRVIAMSAVGLGGVALVMDLGRPDRFYNMLRTFKVTSPMSVGSWILSGYAGALTVAFGADFDRMLGERLPLGPLRKLLRLAENPAGLGAAVFAAPLASYTGVLLSDTAVPTWNAMREGLPYVFVSSASLAASGLAMVTTPVEECGPARKLAVAGVIGDIAFMKWTESRMDETVKEPLHHGESGKLVTWAERLAIAGGVGTLLGGRKRPIAILSGLCLAAASAFTRFGVFEAGLHSARDPKYTIEPQRRRLAARRAAGITDDSITTV
ncbi:NrfD/PsrC family molybdoenzyme membrane anchor subunit [Pseudonocardia phyllosphaerae]|uniref:NrfD/PsrC family molybdoenzyme membrane anchor subunit n=1 Tax=Pseudonocardia phyllosphaerae TaxID=3390502 RepID=UPI00397A7212